MKKILILFLFLTIILSGYAYAANYMIKVPLPGKSAANAKLQYDTLMPVYMSVKTKASSCENMSVINTKVTVQPYNLKYQQGRPVGGEWEELWSVNACSKYYDVPIKFILDPTGATYVISPKNIKLK